MAEPISSENHVDIDTVNPLTDASKSSPGAHHQSSYVQDNPLLRADSKSSEKSGRSRVSAVKPGEELTTGVILIGMDNDATTITESRGSSSLMDQQRPSETNDTDHDDTENNNNNHNAIKQVDSSPSSRRSSASSTDDRVTMPVMLVDRRRSNSSISSTHRRPSIDSIENTNNKPQQSSSTDPPITTPTSISSPTTSRRPSATEFQKFRDQLISTPSNPAFQSENPEWQLHPNPHHPKTKTEILRIERAYTPIALPTKIRVSQITNYDVMIPRFSPTYPPILRDYGIGEGEWMGFIQRVNKSCMEAFDPFRWSNIAVNIIAMLSCWLSEWFMPNLTKKV
jgi:Golgin subfamily A member 7/ERF4 family